MFQKIYFKGNNFGQYNMSRRRSMFSAFRIGPAASGRGLCDIDRDSIIEYSYE